jgi:hypothetical protein
MSQAAAPSGSKDMPLSTLWIDKHGNKKFKDADGEIEYTGLLKDTPGTEADTDTENHNTSTGSDGSGQVPVRVSYLMSSSIFMISSIVAVIQAAQYLYENWSVYNLFSLIVAVLYCLGYGAYTWECYRDSKNPIVGPNGTGSALPMYAMMRSFRF